MRDADLQHRASKMFNERSIKTADNLRRRRKKEEKTAARSLSFLCIEACDPENMVLSGDNEPRDASLQVAPY